MYGAPQRIFEEGNSPYVEVLRDSLQVEEDTEVGGFPEAPTCPNLFRGSLQKEDKFVKSFPVEPQRREMSICK